MKEENSSRTGDLIKKVLTAGLGAVFLTEESLKGLLKEIKLPKEVVNTVLESANKARREFYQRFSQDIINRVVDRVDAKELVEDLVSQNKIKLEVTISFDPKESKE